MAGTGGRAGPAGCWLAQVTTMPALVACRWCSAACCSRVAMLPGPLRWVAEALPLTPVVELMRLALTGTTAAGGHHLGLAATFGAAVSPVLVLTAWIIGGRVGGATLVPLGTAALGRRDTLEG